VHLTLRDLKMKALFAQAAALGLIVIAHGTAHAEVYTANTIIDRGINGGSWSTSVDSISACERAARSITAYLARGASTITICNDFHGVAAAQVMCGGLADAFANRFAQNPEKVSCTRTQFSPATAKAPEAKP
jgi:hypothetical protein